jgi:nitrogenase-stabilizing/protective protein
MTLLDRLEGLSSAEEFFEFLQVDFDPDVVRVARLHIMRRMGQYLKGSELDGLLEGADDERLFALCQEHLAQAYADFVASSPIAERLFKVHKDAVAPKSPPNRPFVPLSAITGA